MFSIISHQVKESKNHSETSLHTHQDMEKLESSHVTGRNVQLVWPRWKIVWLFIERLEFPYDPAIPLLIIYQDKFCKKNKKGRKSPFVQGFYLLRFHFRPVVVTWLQGCPTGMRPHQSPSIPVSTCNLCFPWGREGMIIKMGEEKTAR